MPAFQKTAQSATQISVGEPACPCTMLKGIGLGPNLGFDIGQKVYRMFRSFSFAVLVLWATGAMADGFAVPDLPAVTITAAAPKFSTVAQNIAPVRFDAAHGFERSLANPTLTQLDLDGVPYVYALMRAEREIEQGNRLILARIAADKFSDGSTVTPFGAWQAVPDQVFSIVPPKGSKGVLNAAMTAWDGKILVTYQARSQSKNGADNLGFMEMFDPAAQKVLWTKPIQSIPGYQGTQKPTGLTRVTEGPATAPDYFDSTKGRLVLGYMCRGDQAAACAGWNGFVLQELTYVAGQPQFQPPVRVLHEEVPDGTSLKAWTKQGETVWKKQSFTFGNGSNDRLIFALNFNMVADNTPDHPATRDFPEHAKLFALSGLSTLLDAAKAGALDVSAKAPPSKTWVPDLSNDSPWDQGALWNTMYYVDPFHGSAQFVLYESWGAEVMQASQTRDALYGGSSGQMVKADSPDFGQSCDAICGTGNVAGGGARKSYCLSATAIAPGSALQGVEVAHETPLDQVTAAGQGLKAAFLECSDIGTSATKPGNLLIASAAISAADAGKTALTLAEALCAAKGAKGVVWVDSGTRINLADTQALAQGEALTVGCSTQYPSTAFHRNVVVQGGGPTCDMTCAALGAGDGTGFRAWRAQLADSPYPQQTAAVTPFISLDLLVQQGLTRAKPWVPLQSTALECACGPGREMRGIASARVAP